MKRFWRGTTGVFKRELYSAATTPSAYVFVAAFLSAASLLAFQIGGLFEAGQADLQIFFQFHPWLFLFFMPALSMRLWADEERSGTLETLLSQPVPTLSLVIGKWAASWAIASIALFLTAPLWISLSWLGPVDHGATLANYGGSLLLAGAYLALGSAMSAIGPSQIIAFVLGVGASAALTAAGLPLILDTLTGVLGPTTANFLSRLSLLDQFAGVCRGVIDLHSVLFFLSFSAAWIAVTCFLVEHKRGARS